MRVYLAIKYHPDNQNRERIEKIAAVLERQGIETVCIVRDVEQWGQIKFEPAELMRRTLAEIDTSDVVVVELTEKGVGVGIEAGYAYARAIPIITIARKGSDISTTLQGISQGILFYEGFEELADFFNQAKIKDMKVQ
jgi:nucleoside 2-deoxyribosyltransferase